MKHIEVSKKINIQKKVTQEEFKAALIKRLEKAIEIESIGDGVNEFKVNGTTGTPTSLTRHAKLNLDINLTYDKDKAVRILISGYSKIARSLILMYSLFFVLLMLAGLLPGSFETSYEQSGAVDALLVLLVVVFTVQDINKKLTEPREYLETALQSLDTTFG
jgi:hypothetical protein